MSVSCQLLKTYPKMVWKIFESTICQIRYDITKWTEARLKEIRNMHYKRTKPGWLTEVFELPDPKTLKVGQYSLTWAKSYLHNGVLKCSVPADICIKDEPVAYLISPQHLKTESIFTETGVTQCADETAMIGQIGHENGPADICIKKDPDLDRSPQHLKKETSTETDITMCADETAHKLVILQSLKVPTMEELLAYLYPLCKEKELELDKKRLLCRTGGLKCQRRCEFEKEAFLKKLCKIKDPAEISSHQKGHYSITCAKIPKIERMTKGVKFLKVRQAEPHCVKKGASLMRLTMHLVLKKQITILPTNSNKM
ncbi:unnamed protein product [Coregonus sp. 'balchen']|nr:unnamed protein product [Coregonus sp. 'balchen']